MREAVLDRYREFEVLREGSFAREPLTEFFKTRPHLVAARLAEVGWTLKSAQRDWEASGGLKVGEKSADFDPTVMMDMKDLDGEGRGARLCSALSHSPELWGSLMDF